MRRLPNLDELRRYAIARSLFAPTTLPRAIARLGFVQADPIRAPARAQDLVLRHRVTDYRAGDLERRYPTLDIEEDFFVNYGFLTRQNHALMHPRTPRAEWTTARSKQAEAVLAFVRSQGEVHPRVVDAHFAHGKAINWFGGSSNASTQLLDEMHYRGQLRVARRDSGVRVYSAREVMPAMPTAEQGQAQMDALVDLIVSKYAPLPAATLTQLVSHLRSAAPQWADDRKRALAHAKQRLGQVRIDGIDWYWPPSEQPQWKRYRQQERVHLLAPFDPVVWDRRRFELFWNWAYRFEAYTPADKRKLGYYALPLLWRDQVLGWANVHLVDGRMQVETGYVDKQPREPAFTAALDEELAKLSVFLGLSP